MQLNTKISDKIATELFGYSKTVMSRWKGQTEQRKQRAKWIRLGAIMLENGLSDEDVINLVNGALKVKELINVELEKLKDRR